MAWAWPQAQLAVNKKIPSSTSLDTCPDLACNIRAGHWTPLTTLRTECHESSIHHQDGSLKLPRWLENTPSVVWLAHWNQFIYRAFISERTDLLSGLSPTKKYGELYHHGKEVLVIFSRVCCHLQRRPVPHALHRVAKGCGHWTSRTATHHAPQHNFKSLTVLVIHSTKLHWEVSIQRWRRKMAAFKEVHGLLEANYNACPLLFEIDN